MDGNAETYDTDEHADNEETRNGEKWKMRGMKIIMKMMTITKLLNMTPNKHGKRWECRT